MGNRYRKRRTKMARNCFFYNVVTAVMLLASARVPAVYAANSDWDQIIAAAKREGKVALIGPPGAEVPAALIHGFQKKYPEIQAEFSGLTTQQATTRLRTELAAGVYQVDIFITGTTTALDNLLPAKAIAPIKPFLVGPNVVDASKWKGEKFLFSDDAGTYNLVFTAYVNPLSPTIRIYCRPAKSPHGKICSALSGRAASAREIRPCPAEH
jgi:ABC-type glycerol-3-phosphate transport system substrate-binding protein